MPHSVLCLDLEDYNEGMKRVYTRVSSAAFSLERMIKVGGRAHGRCCTRSHLCGHPEFFNIFSSIMILGGLKMLRGWLWELDNVVQGFYLVTSTEAYGAILGCKLDGIVSSSRQNYADLRVLL